MGNASSMRSNYAALALSFVVTVVGQSKFDNGLLNGTSCVALEEFEQCRLDVVNNLSSSCVNNLGHGSPCVCQKRAEMLNCFGSYCWIFILIQSRSLSQHRSGPHHQKDQVSALAISRR